MARNISNLYDFYLYVCRKERNVFVTPAQFNANMDAGQLDAFSEYFKGYGVNQEIHDALRIFKTYKPYTSDTAGFVTYPSDYLHLLGSPFTVAGSTMNQIKFVNEDEWTVALTSQLRAVSSAYPIALDTNVGFSIYPQATQIGAYWYLRRPAQCVFAYTQVGRAITYDATNSVQLEWEEIYWNHILALALAYAGVNMDDAGIQKFSEMYQQETT